MTGGGNPKAMSKPAQRFIIDTEAGRLVPAFNTLSGTTTPTVYVGDTVPVEVYLVRQPGPGAGLVQQPFPAGAVVRMAVGSVNASPTTGTWVIGYGGNSTSPLAHDVSAAGLQTALNGLASITAAGGVTVDKVANQYRIAFNTNGNRSPFTQGADSLVPASDIQQQVLQEGTVSQPEIVLVNLAMRPIAYTDTFTALDAVTGSHSGTGFQISGPAAGGGYRLQVSYGQNGVTSTVWTDTIPLSAGSQAISQIIYNALVNDGWGFISNSNPTVNSWGLSVTLLGANEYRVDFVAPEFTNPIATVLPTIVGLDVSQVTAYEGKKAVLGLNTVEAVAFLGTKESTRGVLEVEVEAAGETQTLLQASCTILGQVISDGVYSTVPLATLLTEAVGDVRYLRRDADQATDPASLNQIWENITGSTTNPGVDIAGAIAGADAPSAANPFAVASDVQTFDQTLNTTDAVQFLAVNFSNGTSLAKGTFDNGLSGSNGISLNCAVGYELNWQAGRLCSTPDGGATKSDIFLRSNLNFDGDATKGIQFGDYSVQTKAAVFFDQSLNSNDAVDFYSVSLNSGLTFSDATTQTSAPVVSTGTVIHGGGGGHIDALDYPDEVRIVIGGVTYAMPARIV